MDMEVKLGNTQKEMLQFMSSLCWLKPIDKAAASVIARLYARGLVTRRQGEGLPMHYEYQLSDKGLDAVLDV